jgi:beta-lactamase superfamily II metal-dependent hydrolase
MYPTYYKDTECAAEVFRIIDKHVARRARTSSPLTRHSVRVDKLISRALPGLSDAFFFELFSPHIEDMDHSNNSSIVVKLTGLGQGGFSYLITGDTENPRWDRICDLFGDALRSDVLDAAHHGSINGAHARAILHISPHTVLISAGVDSQYGHPHPAAVAAYSAVAERVYCTNVEGGVSLLTRMRGDGFDTQLVA